LLWKTAKFRLVLTATFRLPLAISTGWQRLSRSSGKIFRNRPPNGGVSGPKNFFAISCFWVLPLDLRTD
jgi:hypothetical protein